MTLKSKFRHATSLLLTALLLVGMSACKRDTDREPSPKPTPMPTPMPPVVTNELQMPRKEIRAVWLTTVWELDWPMKRRGEEAQKQLYREYLDAFEELNFNTIFLQVRSMGDAFYETKYEPWSKVLTGTRGQDPGWDVLGFMLDEAHRRGFSVHAWVNPFRIDTSGTPPELHPSIQPEWVTQQGKWTLYDPAEPGARGRVADIVAEIITKYDFDGLHIDDYFYPDPSSAGATPDDAEQYKKYGAAYKTVEDFRRANVDKAVKAIFDTVRKHRPEIPFSVSPAAGYKYNYETLYADIYMWAKEGWMDALIPQLYHHIGHPTADFRVTLHTWAQYSYNASLIVGHGLYRFGDPKSPAPFQSSAELIRQFELSRADKRVKGNAQYSAKYLLMNKVRVRDAFKQLYPTPALRPVLGKVVGSAPAVPNNVQLSQGKINWEGDGAYYAVYYQADGARELLLEEVTREKEYQPREKKGTYYVTALSSNDFESQLSSGVQQK